MGLSQEAMIKFKINLKEALFLEYLSDFISSGKMKHRDYLGARFYWLAYAKILEDLPIIAKTKRTISNLLLSLEKKGIIKKLPNQVNMLFVRIDFDHISETLLKEKANLVLDETETFEDFEKEDDAILAEPTQAVLENVGVDKNAKCIIKNSKNTEKTTKKEQNCENLLNFKTKDAVHCKVQLPKQFEKYADTERFVVVPRVTDLKLDSTVFVNNFECELQEKFGFRMVELLKKFDLRIYSVCKDFVVLTALNASFVNKYIYDKIVRILQSAEELCGSGGA